jgi:thymidylate synthase
MEVHTRKDELPCEILFDFYVLGFKLTEFAPGTTARSCETLGLVVFIQHSNMWGGVEVNTRKDELPCEFLLDLYVLGFKLTAFVPGTTARSCETLGLVVFIQHPNMWGHGSPYSERRATM